MGPDSHSCRFLFDDLKYLIGAAADKRLHHTMPPQKTLTLTHTQYERMRKWALGDFVQPKSGELPPNSPELKNLNVAAQPAALDRAALDACTGGPFEPGIVAGRILLDSETYDRDRPFGHATGPFRISLKTRKAGDITRENSLPWQTDFYDCTEMWWPAQRPNQVRNAHAETRYQWVPNYWNKETMVELWAKLGFVVNETPNSIMNRAGFGGGHFV